jgi:hypothetical protein
LSGRRAFLAKGFLSPKLNGKDTCAQPPVSHKNHPTDVTNGTLGGSDLSLGTQAGAGGTQQ